MGAEVEAVSGIVIVGVVGAVLGAIVLMYYCVQDVQRMAHEPLAEQGLGGPGEEGDSVPPLPPPSGPPPPLDTPIGVSKDALLDNSNGENGDREERKEHRSDSQLEPVGAPVAAQI